MSEPDWDTINKRRHELIERQAIQPLTSEESIELKELQRLAGLKREQLSSPSLEELAAIEADLRSKGLWRGA